MISKTFAIRIFELDQKITIIIFRVDFGKFEIDREFPEFCLIMIFKIFVQKWLEFENEMVSEFTLLVMYKQNHGSTDRRSGPRFEFFSGPNFLNFAGPGSIRCQPALVRGSINPYLLHFGNIQERHLWKKIQNLLFDL